MGQSPSRRRDDYYPSPPPPPPPPPAAPIHHYACYPPPPPSSSHPPPPPPQSYAATYYYQRPPPGTTNHPPPPSSSSSYYYGPGPARPGGAWLAPSAYSAWPAPPPPPPAAAAAAPPEFVEHQQAKTVKNDVNLHKDTIKLVPDEADPDRRLVSFTFDALVDGSVIIYYFAKEGKDCSFSPVYPELQTPTRIPFQKGVAQKFIQPSGSGIDLGFFSLDELSKPLGEVFPLVVYAEACPSPVEADLPTKYTRAQITLAVIEKNNDEFQVKVVKQILWVDGERYELQEIFGIVNSVEAEVPDADDDDVGKECVICLSEPRDTAVFPCRHLCMCSECAKALRLQSNKCPICRQPVEKLMEIKVKSPEV